MSSGEKVLQQPAHLIRLLPERRFALRMVIFYIASARPAAAGELFGLRINVLAIAGTRPERLAIVVIIPFSK